MKSIVRLTMLLLVVALSFAAPAFVAAQDTSPPTVQIGFYYGDGEFTYDLDSVTLEATDPRGAELRTGTASYDQIGVTSYNCNFQNGPGQYYPVGTNLLTCTVYDAAGNSGADTLTVIVQDTMAPVWNASNITAEATSASGAVVSYSASASDAVGVTSQSCAPASGSTFALGTTPVNCTASDAAGNTATASFNVTVQDTTAPTWTVAHITIGTDAGVSTAVVSYSASASDAVGVTSQSCAPASGSTFALGTTTVSCTASDAAGNSASASFNVTVVDDEAPTLSVPADITIGTDAGLATAVVTYPNATASDNVGVSSISCTPASGSTFALGTTPVNCTASDAAGNTATASFNVTVVDDENPVWSVPADISVVATGLSGAAVTYPATASDNVGVTGSSCTPASGSTFALGTTTVSCTASDAAGNSASASFNVTVGVDSGSTNTLISEIEGLGLSNGVENNLTGPLKQATRLLNDNNPDNDGAVCDKLNEFLINVSDRLSQGQLTPTQATLLTNFGQAIKAESGC